MALTDGSAALQKRVAFAEKMRKAKKSDILKGKRDELKKKATDLSQASEEKGAESSKAIGASQDEVPAAAVDMTELF